MPIYPQVLPELWPFNDMFNDRLGNEINKFTIAGNHENKKIDSINSVEAKILIFCEP